MYKILILLCMIFCHIVDDYYLQKGVLTNLKQKKWWETNAPDKMYKQDYKMALFIHSFSWSFMILLVPTIYLLLTKDTDRIIIGLLSLFIMNLIIHYETDDAKANKHMINLIVDQTVHLIQIVLTWIVIICV